MQWFAAAVDWTIMPIAEHLVATTRCGARILAPQRARWLWDRLQARFPDALSCNPMPDHVHLVAPPGGGERFRRVLAGFTARFGVRFDVLPEEPANSAEIATRMIRYGVFNPVRAGLVADPWAWPWSTLRDLGGAVVRIWTPPAQVAAVVEMPTKTVLARLTSTADLRAPLPERTPVTTATFAALQRAVASALRIPDLEVPTLALGRRLVVQA
ncbi:MAG TPA: hypothetical protein VFG69_05410, partial [Nannocystaceae bacterium]|nr:hypothetical protein [Nannocystaceae bacterium]